MRVAFKNCHPFVPSEIHLKDEHIENSDNLDIIMNMYNLIEYSDNYSDSTATLYQFKRQEQAYEDDNIKVIAELTVDKLSAFKYNSNLLGTTQIQILQNANPNIPNAHRL